MLLLHCWSSFLRQLGSFSLDANGGVLSCPNVCGRFKWASVMITCVIVWFRWLVAVEETRQEVPIPVVSLRLSNIRILYIDYAHECFDDTIAIVRGMIVSGHGSVQYRSLSSGRIGHLFLRAPRELVAKNCLTFSFRSQNSRAHLGTS